MPKRPPSLAERLREAMRSEMPTAASAPARHSTPYKGAEFADRLRAAVAARH